MSAPGREGDNLNDLGRGPLAGYIRGLSFMFSDKIFKVFPCMGLCKTSDPRAEPILNPGL